MNCNNEYMCLNYNTFGFFHDIAKSSAGALNSSNEYQSFSINKIEVLRTFGNFTSTAGSKINNNLNVGNIITHIFICKYSKLHEKVDINTRLEIDQNTFTIVNIENVDQANQYIIYKIKLNGKSAVAGSQR